MAFFNSLPGNRGNNKQKRNNNREEYQSRGERSFGASKSKSFGNRDFEARSERSFDNKGFGKSFPKSGAKFGKPGAYKKGPAKRFDKGMSFEEGPSYAKFEYEAKKVPVAPAVVEEVQEIDENILVGRNPIREALKSGRDIEKILVHKGEISGSALEIIAKAKDAKITVQEVDRKRLDQIAPHHQGMIAYASAYQYYDVDDILKKAEQKGEAPFIVMLDGITDPHNLGAIIRSAECAGAHGVIIPTRRSAGLTSTAVKASAGAIEHIMVARVTNLNGMIESLKRKGLWIYAADMDGEQYNTVDFSGPCVLVIGSEGDGVSQLLLENADKTVSIPMKGSIDSLNASVAAGILLFEIAKGR